MGETLGGWYLVSSLDFSFSMSIKDCGTLRSNICPNGIYPCLHSLPHLSLIFPDPSLPCWIHFPRIKNHGHIGFQKSLWEVHFTEMARTDELITSPPVIHSVFLRCQAYANGSVHALANLILIEISWGELLLLTPLLFKDFLRWAFLKSFLNVLQYCSCFKFCFFGHWGMWDLSLPIRDQTHTPLHWKVTS